MSLIVPPGLLIVLSLGIACVVKKKLRIPLILFAGFIYILSISPTARMLIGPLERIYTIPSVDIIRQCDAYVVLGGGVNEEEPTLDGKGMPSGDALSRVMAAYRIYLFSPKPIIISGGNVFGRTPEAEITKRFLLSLGVKENDIIAESKSMDTFENSRYTHEICRKKGYGNILLVTNAYHIKRSMLLFGKLFTGIIPYPTGPKGNHAGYDLFSFLPSAQATADIAVALKEYVGILFYRITL